ncbi:hypothetical protein U1Q18_027705, partial [Sarracenia purpurea var. burkii]
VYATVMDGVLTLCVGVPEHYIVVLGGEGNLSVVDREGDERDILGVADEAVVVVSGPESATVRCGDDVLNEVVMDGEASAREAVGPLLLA